MFPLDSPADPAPPPGASEGDAATAIREAEAALARQNSVAAQVDLQVVTAVLNAHSAHAEGSEALAALQREIESAVSTRTDLDTPAGAREFQRYLLDRLQEIRAVVEDAHLDDTSRASLAAALASLYATAGAAAPPVDPASTVAPPSPRPPVASTGLIEPPVAPTPVEARPDPVDLGLDPVSDAALGFDDLTATPSDPLPIGDAPATVPPGMPPGMSPGMSPAPAPSWGGGVSAPALPPLGGLPAGDLASLAGLARDAVSPSEDPDPEEPPDDPSGEETEAAPPDDGEPGSPSALTGVIADAVAGTPITDAFLRQGIAIPAAGTPVDTPLAAGEVIRGDVGVFADRHALALGNGKALVDNQIQPIDTISGPGFLGWLHPPSASDDAPPGAEA